MTREVQCGILGATGTVGQRFLVLLQDHPYLKIRVLGASSRSAGKVYEKAVRWKMSEAMPESVRKMVVRDCKSSEFLDCDVVFSGLDADVAGEIEADMVAADLAVFSNAKNYRRHPLVPLVVPLVNPSHLDLIPIQRKGILSALASVPSGHTSSGSLISSDRLQAQGKHLQKGFLVTNANCSTTIVVPALDALIKAFGPLSRVQVTTLQAISGAGYPGVASLDIFDNVVPYIGGEEEKIEWECGKILGGIRPKEEEEDILKSQEGHQLVQGMQISAACNRVPVLDGHMACVAVEFASSVQGQDRPSLAAVEKALSGYTCEAQQLGCPSAPSKPIVLFPNPDNGVAPSDVAPALDRPQPRLDRMLGKGYSVSVGRVRADNILDIKFVCLGHNTILGAAGSAILNAEIAYSKEYL